jgi:hypothetical protein
MARGGRTRWGKGVSGNPSGYSKKAASLQSKLRQELEAVGPEAIKKLVQLALEDDNVIALRIIVEKLLPTPRSAPVSAPVELQGDALARAERIVALMADGSLTLEEGAALMTAVAATQTIRDSTQLQDRLAALETKLGALTGGSSPPRPALPAPKGQPDAS